MQNKYAIRLGVCLALGALSAPVAAQTDKPDYEAIVRVMSECAKIGALAARAACYDNTLNAQRLIEGAANGQVPEDKRSQFARPEPAPAPRGFGAETLREPKSASSARADQVDAVVERAARLEPGIFVLTLNDGSKWRFVDAVPSSYDPPRGGSRIELARAALGSFQMHYASQRPVRIRRIE